MKISHGTEMARMQSFHRRASAIETQLQQVSKELTTGLKSDLHEATAGNLGKLHGIERAIARQEAYSRNVTIVEQRLDGMQSGLAKIREPLAELGVDMASAAGISDYMASMTLADSARLDFKQAVSALNTKFNGQSLFAGAGLDSAALESGETILAELDTLVAADATAADVIATIEDYFGDPPATGAFYTNGYVGSTTDMGSVDIAEGDRVDFSVRADDDEIVAALQALALAAVVSGGALSGSQQEQMDVIAEAGTQLIQANESLTDYAGSLGVIQEHVETTKAHNLAESSALDIARANLISSDQTEAATVFQALEAQLETVYTVTSRLSQLSFVNYMGR
ncbi:MAG: flagellin [Pseudomonadota bacterium]